MMGLSQTSFGDEFINKINRKLQERVLRNTSNVQQYTIAPTLNSKLK